MSVENKVPAIRFRGFGGEWKTRGMLDCSSKIGDGLHGTPKYTADSGIYFINGNNLISGSIFITDETKQVNREEQSKSDQALGFNTILISINGTIGNLAWYRGEKVMLGKSVAYISLENCDHSYIYFYLQTKRVNGYFFNNLTGSTIKNLGLKTIRETAVLIPENELEQTKIGNYFQQLDTLIAQHHQKHDKLLNLKKALLELMFPKQGATVPEIRFKGFSGEWDEREFGGDLVSVQTGTNLLGASRNSGRPLIKMGNIQRGYFSLEKVEYLDESVEVEKENIANYGDFLFNTRNTLELVGKGATWMGKSNEFAFNNNIARFTLNGINTIFFNYLYNTQRMIKQVQARAMGTTSVAAIYPQNLKSIEYALPNIEEQNQIANLFQHLDTLINQHQTQLKKLGNIKQACLEKMFV